MKKTNNALSSSYKQMVGTRRTMTTPYTLFLGVIFPGYNLHLRCGAATGRYSKGSAAGSAPIGKILADDGNGDIDPGYRLRFLSGCDALRLQAVPIETRADSGGKA